MNPYNIISTYKDGVFVHTKTLPDGTVLERIGIEGYAEICRRIAAMESDEQALRSRKLIEEQTMQGKEVQLQIEEEAATKKTRLLTITMLERYPSIESFCTGLEMMNTIDSVQTIKF